MKFSHSLLLIQKKLIVRYNQLKEHPLVNNPLLGIIRYSLLNIFLRFKKKPIIWNWVNNIKYYLMIGDSSLIGNCYFFINDYEETTFIINYLDKDETFIDIGSNHGHYTLISSCIVGCKTISVEPVKCTFDRLKMNLNLNKVKNVVLRRVGISNRNGELMITKNLGEINRVIQNKTDKFVEIVKVITIDELLSKETNVSMIKIDVEGYEKQVLSGGKKSLQNNKLNVIQIELNNSNNFYGYDEIETISILEDSGFKPYQYDPSSKKLLKLNKKNTNKRNTLFIRDIEGVRNRLNNKTIKVDRKTITIEYHNPNNINTSQKTNIKREL